MSKSIAIGLVILFFLIGCASTRITSFKAPTVIQQYRKIVVLAQLNDLNLRRVAEEKFVIRLKENGVTAMSSLSLFPPPKAFTEQEMRHTAKDIGYDGILVVSMTDASGHKTLLITPAPLMVEYPKIRCNVELHDVATGESMWVSSSDTMGTWPGMKLDTLFYSLAKSTVLRLEKEGLIQSNKKSESVE